MNSPGRSEKVQSVWKPIISMSYSYQIPLKEFDFLLFFILYSILPNFFFLTCLITLFFISLSSFPGTVYLDGSYSYELPVAFSMCSHRHACCAFWFVHSWIITLSLGSTTIPLFVKITRDSDQGYHKQNMKQRMLPVRIQSGFLWWLKILFLIAITAECSIISWH